MSGAPLRTLIVDDEQLARRRLEILCRNIEGLAIVGQATDGTAAIELIRSRVPDLVLLDIAMPGPNGLGVAGLLADVPDRPAIIFCTAFDNHALAAFAVAAVDYLLKPVDPERLAQAVARVREIRRPRMEPDRSAGDAPAAFVSAWLNHLWVPHRGVMQRLDLRAVSRIDAEGDYVRINAEQGRFLLKETLTRMAEKLDPKMFLQLRRSLIVRADSVRGVRHAGLGAWEALLADGEWVRIGPTHWKVVKARLLAADPHGGP